MGTLKISTGHAKHCLGIGSVKEAYTGGRIDVYTGPVPATADAAATGTLLWSFVNDSQTVKAKQKQRFTPVTAGTTGTWWIELWGYRFTFTDDGSPTVAEVCTGLYNLIRAATGVTSVTTPPGAINIPDLYQKFTLTDNATSLDIEAAAAGVPFEYDSGATGAGNSITESTVTSDAYGLQFEALADISSGELELLATIQWAGEAVAAGTPAYFRVVQDSDTGVLSTTEIRAQGTISTVAGADLVLSHATVAVGEVVNMSTKKLKFPLT